MVLGMESHLSYRGLVILVLLLLLSGLAVGCAPATPAKPSATISQAQQQPGRTPSPTRYYDVAPPPATATAAALQSPTPPVASGSSAGGVKLTILHTNDSRGYVDPCG